MLLFLVFLVFVLKIQKSEKVVKPRTRGPVAKLPLVHPTAFIGDVILFRF